MDNKCMFCFSILESVEYNLSSTYSPHSGTLLINVVRNIVEGLRLPHFNICSKCNDTIIELDSLVARQKQICDQLLKYFHKKNQTEEIASINEFPYIEEEFIIPSEHHDNKNCRNEEIEENEISIKEELVENDSSNSNDILENEPRTVKKKLGHKSIHVCHCSKTFPKKSDLKKHLRIHESHGENVCDICGQTYKDKYGFKVHLEMHNGINRYSCHICNKSFTQRTGLRRHLNIHAGQKLFQCDLCGKAFVHQSSFAMHKLAHKDQKTHKCDLCGLAFRSSSHLNRHKKIHTGEKRHACSTCGKTFAERYNLYAHEKLHSGKNGNIVQKNKLFNKAKNKIMNALFDTDNSEKTIKKELVE